MLADDSSVFMTLDPGTATHRLEKGWEYFVPGDEVEVTLSDGSEVTGWITDMMPGGSAVWVFAYGIGRRLFAAYEDVDIRVVVAVGRPI